MLSLNCGEFKQETFMPQITLQELSQKLAFHVPAIAAVKDEEFQKRKINVSILRLDEIHPVISGNKIFKLYYFLQDAIQSSHKTIITFGGAYSNHLAATSFAGRQMGIKTIGIVRGEEPGKLSNTLEFCRSQEMHLEYISRADYKNIDTDNFKKYTSEKYGPHILIPEGGYSKEGAEGASLISQYFNKNNYTHVCLAIGTATTFAGIVNTIGYTTKVMGFPALKDMTDIHERVNELLNDTTKKYVLNNDYHFGGYAKKTDELISFINKFYLAHHIPLDFVYTAKMMYGVFDLIQKDYFQQGSQILCLHTGGLQGNNSLPKRMLIF